MNKASTLIISGGEIKLEFLTYFLKHQIIDCIIAVDRGLEVLDNIGLLPNYIIGDFDSIDKNILSKYNNIAKIVRLNPEKDFSDTHMALKLAIKLKSNSIYILGAMGKRIDHALANIHILKEALDKNIPCSIIDSHNEIQLITIGEHKIEAVNYKYISLIPLTSKVEIISLDGFKYPLNNATLEIGHSIGISNEIINNTATINLKSGILVMIKSKD